MDFEKPESRGPKAWKEIWGSGQGISAVKAIEPVEKLVSRLETEYRAAKARICA
jgi:nitronate monooxygenase